MSTTLERVQAIPNVTVTSLPRTVEPWRDYDITVSRGDKTYSVGTLTVYDSMLVPSLAMAHHDVTRLQVTARAWNHLLTALGYGTNRDERYRATRGYAIDSRGDEF